MTAVSAGSVIPPVSLSDRPSARGQRSGPVAVRRPLPLAPLALAPRSGEAMYGMAALDDHGRISDRGLIIAMGWAPGTRLAIRETGGLIVINIDRHGVFDVIRDSRLRLPATVRQWCGLHIGDRVFLVGHPDQGLLVVYPPAALDAMISQTHAWLLGGDPA